MTNAKLQAAFKLQHKITMYVPATIHDKEIDNMHYVDEVATKFSIWFGGATALEAKGFWVSVEGGLIKEKVTPVYSFCTKEALKENIDKVVELLEKLKIKLEQEAMALEINGEIHFL